MSLRLKIILLVSALPLAAALSLFIPWLFRVDAVEWGVIVDLDSDSTWADLTNGFDNPEMSRIRRYVADSLQLTECSSLGREPVLYFHSKLPLDLKVQVGFSGGGASSSWPLGNRLIDKSLVWNIHLSPGTLRPFDSIPPFYSYMHDPSSTPIELGKQTTSFLFYEGVIPRPPQLEVHSMDWSDSMIVSNPFPYTIKDVCVRGRSHLFLTAASKCFDSLVPGQTTTIRGEQSESFLSRLRKQGLPEVQARAMDHYWGEQFDRVLTRRAHTIWSYRMPRQEVDARIPVTFSHPFVKLERWIYVYHASIEKVVVCSTVPAGLPDKNHICK